MRRFSLDLQWPVCVDYPVADPVARTSPHPIGDIQRMIENDVDLQPRVRKTKGGYLKTQGSLLN